MWWGSRQGHAFSRAPDLKRWLLIGIELIPATLPSELGYWWIAETDRPGRDNCVRACLFTWDASFPGAELVLEAVVGLENSLDYRLCQYGKGRRLEHFTGAFLQGLQFYMAKFVSLKIKYKFV